MANEHIKIGSNQYEYMETFKYLGPLLTNQNSIHEEMKCGFKQEIGVIIQSKVFCLLDFSRRIWKLKYIKQ